jgi:hypothetical protein
MPMIRALSPLALAACLLLAQPLAAAALECPVAAPGGDQAQQKAIAAALPAGASADTGKLRNAVSALRQKGIAPSAIVDGLIAAYCPAVARDAALSDNAKRARVRHFAAQAVRLAYGLESADAIILDVPFAPDVAATINARAQAEGISPEAFVANAVDAWLAQKR